MTVTTFREAAAVIEELTRTLARVLDDVVPLEEEYFDRWRLAHDPATGDRVGVAGDRIVLYIEDYRPYFDAVTDLAVLAESVDDRLSAMQGAHWRSGEVNA